MSAMRLDEFLARSLAARKIKTAFLDMSPSEWAEEFINDAHGMRLPEELWIQEMPEAEFIINALIAFDLHQAIVEFHEEQEEGE